MRNDERTARYTADNLDDLLRRGGDQSDLDRVRALTDEELEASIDRDEEGDADWDTLQAGIPEPTQQLTVRFDADVVAWFKAQGPGYETRMNAVLRGYVGAQQRRRAAPLGR